MSARNSREAKRLRRLQRQLKTSNVPAHVDIIDWLKRNGHADTTHAAVDMLLAEKVRIGSHPIRDRWVPAGSMDEILVSS